MTAPRLDRAGLIVTATGVVSAGAVSHALDERSSVMFSFGFLLSLALIAFAAYRLASW